MKKLLFLLLLFPFLAQSQINGVIQKTSATGTIRGSFGSLGIDTLANVRLTGIANGMTLIYNSTTKKFHATSAVTSVSALTLGTTGTDLSSTVAAGTTTPVITLNVPTASALNRGVLSSTDWTAFNGKQNQNIVNTTTTTFTTSTLNSTYPSAVIGQAIVCPNLTDGAVTYVKTTSTVWMNFPMGTVL